MMRILFADESCEMIGACFEVYNVSGAGFLEEVYQEALRREFALRKIPATSEAKLEVSYKGEPLDKFYRADFVAHGKIIIELKAVKFLEDIHRAQAHNYLKATGFELALLINFGQTGGLENERIVRSRPKQ